jgi:hypothetical protein
VECSCAQPKPQGEMSKRAITRLLVTRFTHPTLRKREADE